MSNTLSGSDLNELYEGVEPNSDEEAYRDEIREEMEK